MTLGNAAAARVRLLVWCKAATGANPTRLIRLAGTCTLFVKHVGAVSAERHPRDARYNRSR